MGAIYRFNHLIEEVNQMIECINNIMILLGYMSKKIYEKRRAPGRAERSTGKSSQDSRDVLIHAAIKLFAEQGYDGTTTRDIVHATGLNISLISYYFGGKEGLLQACLESIQTKIQDVASPSLVFAETPAEFETRIRAFIASFLGSHVENPYMHRVVQREHERDSPVFNHMVETRYVQWYSQLTAFIAHAQKKLWIRSSIDPMTMAISLYGAMVQQVRLDRFRKELQGISLEDPIQFSKIVDDLATLFGRGLFHI